MHRRNRCSYTRSNRTSTYVNGFRCRHSGRRETDRAVHRRNKYSYIGSNRTYIHVNGFRCRHSGRHETVSETETQLQCRVFHVAIPEGMKPIARHQHIAVIPKLKRTDWSYRRARYTIICIVREFLLDQRAVKRHHEHIATELQEEHSKNTHKSQQLGKGEVAGRGGWSSG